jgi:hypothetical protein
MTYTLLTRYRRSILFAVILILSQSGAAAQQIFTFSDKDSVEVGEIIEITFVIQGNHTSLTLPEDDIFPDAFELISRQRYQASANRDSLVYRLQFFGTDDIVLPSVPFRLQMANGDTTLSSSRIPVYFKSLLSEEDEAFRPFKPVYDFARDVWPYLLALIILIFLGYYFYRLFQRRDHKTEPGTVPAPVPFDNPIEQLRNTLRNLPPPEKIHQFEEYESFYIELGDAIRLYIKRVYLFPALEMTTREICHTLESELAPASTVKLTRTVLNEADMVKFANFRPDTELASNVLRLAWEFHDQASVSDRSRIERLRMEYETHPDLVQVSETDNSVNENHVLSEENEPAGREEKL